MQNPNRHLGENRNRGGSRGPRRNRSNTKPYNSRSHSSGPSSNRRENDRPHRDHSAHRSNNNNPSGENRRDRNPPRNEHNQHSKKFIVRQMGFKFLQELLKNDDLEDVVFQLNNDRRGFRELLDSRDMSNDVIILLVQLLRRICEFHFPSTKIQLFQTALSSNFAERAVQYVSTIVYQNVREKQFNSLFWCDTDNFWNNIIVIARTLNDIIPIASCEVMTKLLKAIKLNIPLIETSHSIHISDSIKIGIEDLLNVVEKTSIEVERKKQEPCSGALVGTEELEPDDDFRDINVYPNAMEVTQPGSPFLRPNVTEGPYRDIHHYLDVQFRLLREDFVAPLRKAICSYLKNPKDRLENVKIYKSVRFLCSEIVTAENCFRIQYEPSNKKRTFQYENSRRFMFGALLCFTSNNFKTLLFAKVVKRDIKDLQEKGQLIVGFSKEIILPDNLFNVDFDMVESMVYFEPYYRVLSVLKSMQNDNFPMERYIIQVKTDAQPPDYLLQIDPQFFTIEGKRFWPLDWGERRFYGLNDAQSEAFKAALTKEFAIIQGPPGTGKTFLGLKIAQTLIKNNSIWYKNTPMLVICFTNHALDQFLEGLLPITQKVLRVGGQSKNENLNSYNIRNNKNRQNHNPAVAQKRYEVRNTLQSISSINQHLSVIAERTVVIDFGAFRDVIPNFRDSWFDTASKEELVSWLLAGAHTNFHRTRHDQKKPQALSDNRQLVDNEEGENNAVEAMQKEDDDGEIIDEVFQDIEVRSVRNLMTLKTLNNRLAELEQQLAMISTNDMIEEWRIHEQKDQLYFEIHRTENELEYLRVMLSIGNINNEEPPQFLNWTNPNYMHPNERWQLYFHWLGLYIDHLKQQKEALTRIFKRNYAVYSEMQDMEDAQIMKDSLVVGMTTTGAARLNSSLQTLKSPIVIVEEAAEVLEAHIISSLTSHCKHLILIGDHQQLKPSTADFKIETKYRLGISLFERMVINKIQCHKLNVQHRMRPEISSLIRPTIYRELDDHESVLNRPQIFGVQPCVYFLDHREHEQLCKDNSKKNVHEAKFLIHLARHLILNGYKPENITILAAYLGQMFEMHREKKVYNNILQDVRISVLDNYQGEESDIVLLSLVRSNDDNKIGFLKIENRVCVALSRARNGFYMMGNMAQLCGSSEIWKNIKETLEKQDAIGSTLPLRCQIHQKLTFVAKADDFATVLEGGCDQMCNASLRCGHVCKRLCHIEDKEHASYKCLEKCENVLCDDPAHVCRKLCHEECGLCTYPVHRQLQCGHSAVISCHIEPAKYKCMERMLTKLPCGHEDMKPCHMDANTYKCPHPCDSRVEPCGHACLLNCHIRNDPDHLEYKCMKPCDRYRKGCTLQNNEAHLCPNKCFEDCPECEILVLKKRTKCSHAFKVPCIQDVDLIDCKKPCKRPLPCGHNCSRPCGVSCGGCTVLVRKTVPDCNHEIEIECSKEPVRKYCKGSCPRLLACGHVCTMKCNEPCTTDCQEIVDCSISSPCGHVMKKVKCSMKNAVLPKDLLTLCSEKCTFKLKCNHMCGGTCGECSQGRFHKSCVEKCGVPLVCNHECPIPCREACRPCLQPCRYRCKHSKCKRRCGDPCTMCREPCPRKCKHQKCKNFCGDMCSIPPCQHRCDKKLPKCKHPCIGFCGEPCPILCKICDNKELTEIFLGNEDEDDAVYVMLEDCKHIFESSDMERWLESDDNEIKAKVCPKCKTTITTTVRYNKYIKVNMNDMYKVKVKYYGSHEKNAREKLLLLQQIYKLEGDVSYYCGMRRLDRAMARLRLRIGERKDNRRQTINKMDLDAIKSKLLLLEAVINLFKEHNFDSDNSLWHCQSIKNQTSSIINVVMRGEEDSISEQQIQDVLLEINRLRRYMQFERMKRSSLNHSSSYTNKVENIQKILDSPSRYSTAIDDTLKSELEELKKITASKLGITDAERIEIVKAVGLTLGHWFKCPNGHPYAIGECGGAMQVSKCNECGAPIGGTHHALLPGQTVATEMDGARHGAWSDAANMQNYQF